jgi:trimeric autotransporter adhesin
MHRIARSLVIGWPLVALLVLFPRPVEAQAQPTLLELRSGSPASDRLRVDSAGGLVALGTLNRGAIPVEGAGARMMWYPSKAAFRVGRVTGTQWDNATVGSYSLATGYNTTASGGYSTAMGFNTTASGDYSTAMGSTTTASGATSTTMGYTTTASGPTSTAMGSSTTASGARSTAMGYNTRASGSQSTAMGDKTTASGTSSTAMGSFTTASGDYSTAMGSFTTASGDYSTAMGSYASTADFAGAFVYGDASTTTVLNATALHQFSVRAAGGIRLFTNSALTAGMTLAAGGSSWNTVSDRARKHDFGVVDGEDLLARIRGIPVMSWRYIAEADATVRHIGPMAQDWDAALPELGGTGLTINMSDLDGVNLAAIQALEARSAAQAAQIDAQTEEIAAQREQIAAQRDVIADLLARVRRLESRPHDTAARRR